MGIIHKLFFRPYLYLLITLAGILLKFYHLDHKLLWIDEIYTIQHTSGIPESAYPALIPENEINNIDIFYDIYRLNKHDYTLYSQLKGLAVSTQLNPLHYPLLMLWYRVVGDDPVHFRLFSVFIFIITLPFLFLLARKLFDSDIAGWIAVSLYAVSPFIHLFAQEARYYIFWSFILVVLHYLYIQVIQLNSIKCWSAYTITAALSLYASPVSCIILAGHCAMVALTRRDLLNKLGISLLIVFTAYLPWAIWLLINLDEIIYALSWQINNQFNVAFWLPLLGQCFYLISIFSFKLDYFTAFKQITSKIPDDAAGAMLFNLIVLIFIGIAVIFLFRKTTKEIRYFLLLIIIPGSMLFYFNDLIRNGMTSWWWRYLIFIAPGVILVMTNFMYIKVINGNLFYFVSYLALVFIGISSIVSISGARHWHIGSQMDVYLENARLISGSEKPLLISDFADNRSMVDFMVVTHECNSTDIDFLRTSSGIESLETMINGAEYSDIFVIYASDELIGNLKSRFGYRMEKLDIEGISSIWRIIIEKQ